MCHNLDCCGIKKLKLKLPAVSHRKTRTQKQNSHVSLHLVIPTYSCKRTYGGYFERNATLWSPPQYALDVINRYISPLPIPYSPDGRVCFHVSYSSHSEMLCERGKHAGFSVPVLKLNDSKPFCDVMGSAIC
jgi:hypothetical protein